MTIEEAKTIVRECVVNPDEYREAANLLADYAEAIRNLADSPMESFQPWEWNAPGTTGSVTRTFSKL